jgi:hypothetical protein
VVAGPDLLPRPRPEAYTADDRGANGVDVAGVIYWLVACFWWMLHYPGSFIGSAAPTRNAPRRRTGWGGTFRSEPALTIIARRDGKAK